MNNFLSTGALIITGVVLPPFLTAVASLFGKRRFRQQGIAASGVAGIMSDAGLTIGGQFSVGAGGRISDHA